MSNGVVEKNLIYVTGTSSNQINTGYKQTEIGFIPVDWEITNLRDIAIFGGGTTPPRKFHEKYYVSGLHPWVKTLDLNNSLILVTEEYVTNAALVETSLKKHPAGSVLIAMYGGFNQIGRTGVIKVDAAINQALIAIIPKNSKLVSEYLLFNLNYNVEYWKGVASSSRKDPNITSNDVKNYLLALPSKKEQTAIANALSDVDALISELENLIAKKQAIKTATMQQLLTGRTRLPQFALREDGAPKGTKPSELGEIPEDWEVHSLGDLCNYQNGKAQEQYFNSNGGYKVVSIGNYSESGRYIDTGSYIDEKFKNEVGRFVLSRGDLAMILNDKTAIGTIIGRVLLIEADETYVMNQRTMRLAPKGSVKSKYLHFLLNSDSVHKRIVGMAKPGTQIYVNTDDVLGFNLLISNSQEEQTAISTILSDMDDEIQALEQRLGKTRQIKQGMMQELLTGKTRLPYDKE
ncbi:restriction endonuclease subunit S [Proteus mirabilis]|uniref:restriction endonuclease subunit S n=1 Tax=Proteus mirabilis TaxID=584 RepID=UPI00369C28A0